MAEIKTKLEVSSVKSQFQNGIQGPKGDKGDQGEPGPQGPAGGNITTASQLPNVPSGNISAVTVQAAINELDTEKADKLNATNLVTNGDFSVDSNADGLADNWIKPQAGNSASIVSGWQRITNVSSNRLELRQTLTLTSGRKYYIRFSFRTNYVGAAALAVSDNTYVETLYSTLTRSGNFSTVFTPSTTKSDISFRIYHGSDVLVNDYFEFDYITIIDLTAIFGAGKEPSAIQMDNLLSTFPNSWFNGTAELVSIANLAQLKADKTQEAWITPTLLNSWVQNASFENIGFMKDAFGFVNVRGGVSSGTLNTAVFNFPAGYRATSYKLTYFRVASSGGTSEIEINHGTGAIKIVNGSNAWVDLSTIRFKVV